ncbi:hypothetical protein QBC42DRAFT_276877 [Cladorrhinum samala]|uniref:Uncharacterized protein n=1 Tax=Cladorrhinum samala TaxID=585594 RepID=A0AAV9HCH0_9PEZI|nr:hypothetical protein QBC42DRAFT_276877 [Cladorrhinum samala]
MVSKNREYHVTASQGWFPFLAPIPASAREKAEPSPTYSVPKHARRQKTSTKAEEPSRKPKSSGLAKSKETTVKGKKPVKEPEVKKYDVKKRPEPRSPQMKLLEASREPGVSVLEIMEPEITEPEFTEPETEDSEATELIIKDLEPSNPVAQYQEPQDQEAQDPLVRYQETKHHETVNPVAKYQEFEDQEAQSPLVKYQEIEHQESMNPMAKYQEPQDQEAQSPLVQYQEIEHQEPMIPVANYQEPEDQEAQDSLVRYQEVEHQEPVSPVAKYQEPQDQDVPEAELQSPGTPISESSCQWSKWFPGEEGKYMWRARQLPDESWEYQYIDPKTGKPRSHSQETASSASSSFASADRVPAFSGSDSPEFHSRIIPLLPGRGSIISASSRQPRSSYPTIITTSTGLPTVPLPPYSSPSSSFCASPSLLAPRFMIKEEEPEPIPIEHGQGSGQRHKGKQQLQSKNDKVPIITVTKPVNHHRHSSATTSHDAKLPAITDKRTKSGGSSPRRPPMSPVMWLLQEGSRSRKSRSVNSNSYATSKTCLSPGGSNNNNNNDNNNNANFLLEGPTGVMTVGYVAEREGGVESGGGGGVSGQGKVAATKMDNNNKVTMAQIAKSRTAYGKKFDKKIRSEKEVKMDSKKRVKNWLKGIEKAGGGAEVVEFDREGLVIYKVRN